MYGQKSIANAHIDLRKFAMLTIHCRTRDEKISMKYIKNSISTIHIWLQSDPWVTAVKGYCSNFSVTFWQNYCYLSNFWKLLLSFVTAENFGSSKFCSNFFRISNVFKKNFLLIFYLLNFPHFPTQYVKAIRE